MISLEQERKGQQQPLLREAKEASGVVSSPSASATARLDVTRNAQSNKGYPGRHRDVVSSLKASYGSGTGQTNFIRPAATSGSGTPPDAVTPRTRRMSLVCNTCNKVFKDYGSLSQHMRDRHLGASRSAVRPLTFNLSDYFPSSSALCSAAPSPARPAGEGPVPTLDVKRKPKKAKVLHTASNLLQAKGLSLKHKAATHVGSKGKGQKLPPRRIGPKRWSHLSSTKKAILSRRMLTLEVKIGTAQSEYQACLAHLDALRDQFAEVEQRLLHDEGQSSAAPQKTLGHDGSTRDAAHAPLAMKAGQKIVAQAEALVQRKQQEVEGLRILLAAVVKPNMEGNKIVQRRSIAEVMEEKLKGPERGGRQEEEEADIGGDISLKEVPEFERSEKTQLGVSSSGFEKHFWKGGVVAPLMEDMSSSNESDSDDGKEVVPGAPGFRDVLSQWAQGAQAALQWLKPHRSTSPREADSCSEQVQGAPETEARVLPMQPVQVEKEPVAPPVKDSITGIGVGAVSLAPPQVLKSPAVEDLSEVAFKEALIQGARDLTVGRRADGSTRVTVVVAPGGPSGPVDIPDRISQARSGNQQAFFPVASKGLSELPLAMPSVIGLTSSGRQVSQGLTSPVADQFTFGRAMMDTGRGHQQAASKGPALQPQVLLSPVVRQHCDATSMVDPHLGHLQHQQQHPGEAGTSTGRLMSTSRHDGCYVRTSNHLNSLHGGIPSWVTLPGPQLLMGGGPPGDLVPLGNHLLTQTDIVYMQQPLAGATPALEPALSMDSLPFFTGNMGSTAFDTGIPQLANDSLYLQPSGLSHPDRTGSASLLYAPSLGGQQHIGKGTSLQLGRSFSGPSSVVQSVPSPLQHPVARTQTPGAPVHMAGLRDAYLGQLVQVPMGSGGQALSPRQSMIMHLLPGGAGHQAGLDRPSSSCSWNSALEGPSSPAYVCETCGITCNSALTLQQHMVSKRHLQKAVHQELAGVHEVAEQLAQMTMTREVPRVLTNVAPDIPDYCQQIITPELNHAVSVVLQQLKMFQDRAMARNIVKGSSKRWYVAGLREVRKCVKLNKAHAVVLAPNIEQAEAGGGLNEHVHSILDTCKETSVPVIFALNRKKLGEIYGFRKRMSAIAVLEVSGIHDLYQHMLQMAEEGRQLWRISLAMNPQIALIQHKGRGGEGDESAA